MGTEELRCYLAYLSPLLADTVEKSLQKVSGLGCPEQASSRKIKSCLVSPYIFLNKACLPRYNFSVIGRK